jgi:two-component system NtrC family sensor kinase
MNASKTSALEGLGQPPDSAFQKLLLRSSLSESEDVTPTSRIRQFCQTTREFFQVDGAYFWQYTPPDELVGSEADGLMAELFGGTRLKASDNAVLKEAIQQRKTVFVNHLPSRFKLASQFQARALMAAPLIVSNEVVGAAAYLHMSDPAFFNEDLAAKATILTRQLSSWLEANSSSAIGFQVPRREGVSRPLNPFGVLPDSSTMMEGLADRLRLLLRTRLICVLQRQGGSFSLQAVAAESPHLAASIRARHDQRGLQFASDLAIRALNAGEPITVSIDPATYALGDLLSPGILISAPFRTAQSQGAVLVYPRREGSFSETDKSLVATITGFGAVALAHAELNATAHAEVQELQQVLEAIAEVNAVGPPELLMQRLTVRAADFLGFGRSCVGVREEGTFHIRWKAEHGQPGQLDLRMQPQGIVSRTLLSKEVFWTDDFSQIPGADIKRITDFNLRQLLAVPLLASDGSVLGLFGVLDRLDGAGISRDDIRRTRVLATHLSAALEKAQLFARMEQANRHWIEIFDAISDFIVVHDEGSKVLRINRSLADFIGVTPPALIGVEMSALFGMGSPTMLRTCPFCREPGEIGDEQIHSLLEHTYLVSSSQSRSTNREGLQTIHVLKDITDSHEAERRYRELFGNIQEGLFFATPDGRFVEVNDSLVRMLGYASREELLQADIRTQIYPSADQYQAFAEKMQQQGGVKNHEEALRRKDGTPVYVLINGFAVRDSYGRILQYRGLMLDISGLKTFQTELQRERDFSGKILNHTQSLILVVDKSGTISYANRRWYDMGYEQRQMLGLPLRELVSPTRRHQLDEALDVTLQGQQVDNLDLQILRQDSSIGQFSVNLSPMRDEQGVVNSVVVVMTDVTDAATLQAKLMHAEKMAAVGQLVSGVAHEVNNPLTAILGFADLLMDNNDLPEAVRRDLRVILQEAQRTKQIVQNLLSFARQMPPQRTAVQLNAILRRTVQLRAYDFNSHGVEVIEHFDESLPDVIGDSQQLQQVFLNIVNNAYDAVHEGGNKGRIEIMTTRRGKFVEVWFRDNGHGISHPERIFDPFFTTKEVGKGTGLGLSICYGIVREHGGEILCQNNIDGPGATFIVRLPSVSDAASIGGIVGVSQL